MTPPASTLRRHWRELTFGFAATLLAGFGQTYFVSLFLLSLVSELDISQGRFGSIYSAATLGAGLLLSRC